MSRAGRVALGLGCDRGTPLETIEEAVTQALAQAGVGLEAVAAAATWHGRAADALAAREGETPVRTTQILSGLSPALRAARAAANGRG